MENVFAKGQVHAQRIIATGLPEMSFYFSTPPTSSQRSLEGNVLISGQQNDYYDLLVSETLHLFSVTFQPHGLSAFFELPLSELQNQTVLADHISKAYSAQIADEMGATDSFARRVEIIERHFLKLLAKQTTSVDRQRMAYAVEVIRKAKGAVSIDYLAANACLSRKQFERKFLHYIGISPKQFLKIIRFQNAIYLKQHREGISLTELAFEGGYYDQSHLINDIKDLTGQTPKKLFGAGGVISDFFS